MKVAKTKQSALMMLKQTNHKDTSESITTKKTQYPYIDCSKLIYSSLLFLSIPQTHNACPTSNESLLNNNKTGTIAKPNEKKSKLETQSKTRTQGEMTKQIQT